MEVWRQLATNIASGASPLRRWLFENRDEIAPLMAGPRPRWAALSKTLIAAGIADANGNPPNRHAVRKAWQKIEHDMNLQRSNCRPETSAPAPELVTAAPSRAG